MFNTPEGPRKDLSELEHEIMEILWASGPASSEQIRDRLAPKRPLKDSTVRTVLRRLHAKGYVNYEVTGRTYIYRGSEPRRNVALRAVRQILDRFCEGSLEQLLVGLVEGEVVSRSELRELAQKIARSPRGSKRGGT